MKELVDRGQKCKRDVGSDYRPILRAKTNGFESVRVACIMRNRNTKRLLRALQYYCVHMRLFITTDH